MNQNFLSEENYQRINKKIKIAGILIIILGLTLLLCGIFVVKVPEMDSFADDWFEKQTLKTFLIFIGIFLMIAGLIVRFVIPNQRKIAAYNMQSQMPIAKEGLEEMSPTISKVAKDIHDSINDDTRK